MIATAGAGVIKGGFDWLSNRQQAGAAQDALAAQQQAANAAAANASQNAAQTQNLITGAQGAQEQALGSGYGGAAEALGGYGDQASALLAGYGDLATGAIGGALGMYQDPFAGFQADPGYQFRQQQGEQAINRSAAARGGRLGGDTLKELANFNSGLASQEFGNYANRQMGLLGQQSGLYGQLAGLYGTQGGQLADISTGIGSGLANLGVGQGTALSNLYGTNAANVGNALMGAAGANTSLTQSMLPAYGAPTQYAGGGAQAFGEAGSNFLNNLAFYNAASPQQQQPPAEIPGYAIA